MPRSRLRSAVSRLLWAGRLSSSLFGLALLLVLGMGLGTTALAAVPGDPLKLGRPNAIDRLTSLAGSSATALFKIDNNGAGPALNLAVEPSRPPLVVSAGAGKATNLNADLLDGVEASSLSDPRGYAHVKPEGALNAVYPSKGVNGVVAPDLGPDLPPERNNLYCFDLAFTPAAAVGAPNINNAAWVSTLTPRSSGTLDLTCPEGYRDAAVKTYGSDGVGAAINFTIVFV